jgi:hypothetical protein
VPLEVSVSDEGPPAYSTPTLTITARELLARSDAAMREVEYLRVYEAWPGEPTSRSWWFNIEETAGQLLLRAVFGATLVEMGDRLVWYEHRIPDGLEPYIATFLFDRAEGAKGAGHIEPQTFRPDEVRLIGEDLMNGRPAWMIWYHHTISGFEGPITTWVREWIDQASLQVLRQETNSSDPATSLGVLTPIDRLRC